MWQRHMRANGKAVCDGVNLERVGNEDGASVWVRARTDGWWTSGGGRGGSVRGAARKGGAAAGRSLVQFSLLAALLCGWQCFDFCRQSSSRCGFRRCASRRSALVIGFHQGIQSDGLPRTAFPNLHASLAIANSTHGDRTRRTIMTGREPASLMRLPRAWARAPS